jgi:RNA polymerase sigma-70 factor (ECF subfamily)
MAAGGDPAEDISLELVHRIQAGDDSAWEALYARHRDRLLFAIRCRLGPALRARLQSEDILQSVMKDAIHGLEGFQPEQQHALAHYLHVCALNKIRGKADHYAAQKRRGEVPLSPSVADGLPDPAPPGLCYHDSDRYERLEKALAALPENLREVVLLRRIENLSNVAAAEVLGKTPEATSKLFARAMARLGTVLRAGEAS